jgi:hypothetical protein
MRVYGVARAMSARPNAPAGVRAARRDARSVSRRPESRRAPCDKHRGCLGVVQVRGFHSFPFSAQQVPGPNLVPPYTRGSDCLSLSNTVGKAKAWSLLNKHAEASLSFQDNLSRCVPDLT